MKFLSNETAKFLSNETVKFLSNETVKFLSNETVKFLSNETVKFLSNETVTFLSNETVKFLSNEPVKFLSNETVNAQYSQNSSGDDVDVCTSSFSETAVTASGLYFRRINRWARTHHLEVASAGTQVLSAGCFWICFWSRTDNALPVAVYELNY